MLEDMDRFQESQAGVLEIRTGLFGWKWVSNMWPAVLVYVDEQGESQALTVEQRRILRDSQSNELPFEVDLAIDRGKDGYMPTSGRLRQHVANRGIEEE